MGNLKYLLIVLLVAYCSCCTPQPTLPYSPIIDAKEEYIGKMAILHDDKCCYWYNHHRNWVDDDCGKYNIGDSIK